MRVPYAWLAEMVEELPALRRLVHGRWLYLAALDPEGSAVTEISADGARAYQPEHPVGRAVSSLDHFKGRRGHLPFVELGPSSNERVP